MAPFAFTNPTIYVGGYDMTCDLRQINGSYNPNFLDVTTFCSGGWHARIMGLNDFDFNAEGFNDFSAAGIDATMAPLYGTTQVVTVVPNSTPLAGDAAYLFRALSVGEHSTAVVGEAATFALPFKGQQQMISGDLAAPRASVAVSGSSSAVQSGTASNGQVFATRNVFSSAGNLASWIESSTNASFLGAVTRVAFTTISAAGGEFVSATISTTAGSFWRARWVTAAANDFSISFAIR